METRPSWDQYFMNFAKLAATRASCLRRKVGAVIVFDKQVISTGYNGPPRGVRECQPLLKCDTCNGTGRLFDGEVPRCITCSGKGKRVVSDYTCLRDLHEIPSGERIEMCRGTHAEANAIIQAARTGGCTKNGTLYCTHKPCLTCAKMIINAGIVDICYRESYPDPLTERFLIEARILFRQQED